jgi:hypothetical protein
MTCRREVLGNLPRAAAGLSWKKIENRTLRLFDIITLITTYSHLLFIVKGNILDGVGGRNSKSWEKI